MSTTGKLQLTLRDAEGRPLGTGVHVRLEHLLLSEIRMVRDADASRAILIEDLRAAPEGCYRLEVDPLSYRPAGQLVDVQADGVTELEIRVQAAREAKKVA